MKKNIRGLSLFSGSGIGEYFLSRVGIDIIVANELIKKRADLYQKIYPNHKMVTGDIRNQSIFNKVLNVALANQVDFLIASPPCQGMSVAGKNRDVSNMATDNRN
ncbi:TPA: DNA cytosine methyltransferase, partial [Haemophilus influenzae]